MWARLKIVTHKSTAAFVFFLFVSPDAPRPLIAYLGDCAFFLTALESQARGREKKQPCEEKTCVSSAKSVWAEQMESDGA